MTQKIIPSQNKADLPEIKLMLLGLDSASLAWIQSHYSKEQLSKPLYQLSYLSDSSFLENPTLILIGSPPPETTIREVAQILRMKYPQHGIYYLSSQREGYDRNTLKKNGFTDAFLLPHDQTLAFQTLQKEISDFTQGKIKAYRPVCLIDLQAGQPLNFDTYMYLPKNKKHIKISQEGDALEQDWIDKLKNANFTRLHVSLDQMPNFFKFAAQQLRTLHQGEGISQTEKKHRMTEAIRNLLSGVFSTSTQDATIDQGRSLVQDCQKIVKEFMNDGTENGSWYDKLLQSAEAEEGAYHHASNVATFGVLFSLATQVGNPEHIALAALLHDTGLADVDIEIQNKTETERTPKEQELYQKHVEHSLNLIKFRKMILPDPVIRAIQQHHERWSGTGYPKGVAGARITPEAQILALADQFDYYTLRQDGSMRVFPHQAFLDLYERDIHDPAHAYFDAELLKKMIDLFNSDVEEKEK